MSDGVFVCCKTLFQKPFRDRRPAKSALQSDGADPIAGVRSSPIVPSADCSLEPRGFEPKLSSGRNQLELLRVSAKPRRQGESDPACEARRGV